MTSQSWLILVLNWYPTKGIIESTLFGVSQKMGLKSQVSLWDVLYKELCHLQVVDRNLRLDRGGPQRDATAVMSKSENINALRIALLSENESKRILKQPKDCLFYSDYLKYSIDFVIFFQNNILMYPFKTIISRIWNIKKPCSAMLRLLKW